MKLIFFKLTGIQIFILKKKILPKGLIFFISMNAIHQNTLTFIKKEETEASAVSNTNDCFFEWLPRDCIYLIAGRLNSRSFVKFLKSYPEFSYVTGSLPLDVDEMTNLALNCISEQTTKHLKQDYHGKNKRLLKTEIHQACLRFFKGGRTVDLYSRRRWILHALTDIGKATGWWSCGDITHQRISNNGYFFTLVVLIVGTK